MQLLRKNHTPAQSSYEGVDVQFGGKLVDEAVEGLEQRGLVLPRQHGDVLQQNLVSDDLLQLHSGRCTWQQIYCVKSGRVYWCHSTTDEYFIRYLYEQSWLLGVYTD